MKTITVKKRVNSIIEHRMTMQKLMNQKKDFQVIPSIGLFIIKTDIIAN